MKRRIIVAFSLIAVISVTLALLVIRESVKDTAEYQYAESINDIVFEISMTSTKNTVNLYEDSGVYYLFLPAGCTSWKAANISPKDKLTISDDTIFFYSETSNHTDSFKFCVMKSSNIGSIFIDLDDDIEREQMDSLHKEKFPANIKVFDEEGKLNVVQNLEFIRTRGNSSYFSPNTLKKPYEIKLGTKESLYGMPETKKWVLLANFYDKSLVRDALVYDFTDKYTEVKSEKGVFTDLYINGEYLGNYYLCEKVKTDNDSEYLVEQIAEYLMEEDNYYFTTNSGYLYEIKSPENPTDEQIDYITGVFNELEEAVKSEAGINPLTGRHYSEILDINSYVDKYLVEMTFMNGDCDINSQYYYKMSEAPEDKLIAGPVWDYDLAMDYSTSPYLFQHFYLCEYILDFDEVNELLKDRYYSVFRPFVEESVGVVLNDYKSLLHDSYEMNHMRWDYNHEVFAYGYTSIDANFEFIERKLKQRIEYMDSLLIEKDLSVSVIYDSDGYPIAAVKTGDTFNDLRERNVNLWGINVGSIDNATGELLTKDTVISGDTYCQNAVVYFDYLLGNDFQILQQDEWVARLNPDDLRKIANVVRRMQADEE